MKKQRDIVARILFVLLMLIITLLITSFARIMNANNPNVYKEHVVMPGETIWEIAAKYKVPGEDTRKAVWEIRHINGIDCVIRVGDVIKVKDVVN